MTPITTPTTTPTDHPATDTPPASPPRSNDLKPPAVDPAVYDTEYYLGCCAGYEQWVTSGGANPDALYGGSLDRARLAPGDVLVDLGTGRGELLAVAVARGASRAIGFDYSPSAVALARRTLEVAGVTGSAGNGEVGVANTGAVTGTTTTAGSAGVVAADTRAIPLASGTVDLVTMLDIVEHLTPTELHETLGEVRRLLRPGGRIFCHTMPTRTVYQVTYRLQRLARPSRWRRWPADPRNRFEHAMHVNEQTRRSLRRALGRAGFTGVDVRYGEWVYESFVPEVRARRLYHLLGRRRLTRGLGIGDLWAEASAPR